MKKYLLAIITFILLLLLSYFYFNAKEKEDFLNYKVDLNNFNLSLTMKKDCLSEKELYYVDENNINYYTSCISKITDNNGYDFKKLLEAKKVTIKEILDTYDKETYNYDDGGSKEYINKECNIIKCHTILGNNDIIITDKVTNIQDGFCNEEFQKDKGFCEFTQTYFINKILAKNKEKTLVEVSRLNKTESVFINNYIVSNLKEKKYYEFTFFNYQGDIKENIEDIFKNYNLSSYAEVLKEGRDEKVCTSISRDIVRKAYYYLDDKEKEDFENINNVYKEVKYNNTLNIINKKNKKETIKNKDLILINFTKKENNLKEDINVVLDLETKEILGIEI